MASAGGLVFTSPGRRVGMLSLGSISIRVSGTAASRGVIGVSTVFRTFCAFSVGRHFLVL